MDRFDDMRAKVAINQEESGGSTGGGGSSGENTGGNAYLGGTTVTIEPTVSLSKGDRFVGVKNADATVQMAYTGLGGVSNLAVISEDLEVGIVTASLATTAKTLQIAFLTDDYYYEYVDVDIPSGALTTSVAINYSNATINEDGTLIVIKGLNDDEGINRRLLIIDVNKTSKSATVDYQDLGGEMTNYTLPDSTETSWHTVSDFKRTGPYVSIRLTKNFLICTSQISYTSTTHTANPETEDYVTTYKTNATTIHKYTGGSFRTTPSYTLYSGSGGSIKNYDTANQAICKATGWYDDNTLLMVHAITSSNSVGSKLHKFVFDGYDVISHSSTGGIGSATTKGNPSYTMSKNGCYIGYRCMYDTSRYYNYAYRVNPLDMTVTSLGTSFGALSYFTSDGDYYLASSGINKTSDNSLAYSAKAMGSRHFEFTNGKFYRSGAFKCYLSPATDAEYVVSTNYGDCTPDGNIYGIVNESLNAGEKGTGQLLFTSGVVGTGTSDIEGVVSPPRFINHIEFTGTQYIDTGLPVAPNFYVYTDFLVSSAPDSSGAVIIGTSNSNNYRFWTCTIQQALTMNCGLINNCVSTKAIELNKRHHVAVKFFNGDQQLYVNDELYCSATNTANSSQLSSFASLSNLRIGAKVYNATNGFFKGKIYAFRIYDENKVLIRDFKPAIYNNQYCLYDVVESKPYYNAGTGEFMGDGEFKEMVETDIPEPDNTPTFIDYIESSGTQYVDTGITTKTGIKVEACSQLTSLASGTYLFGARVATASQRNDLMLYYNTSKSRTEMYYYYSNNGYNFCTDADSFFSAKNTYETIDGKLVVNGTTLIEKTGTAFTSDLSMFIFCTNNNGTPNGYSYLKLYSCKIYDGDTLVRDLKPAIVRNQYCLYDMVESRPYFNAGTGAFTGA